MEEITILNQVETNDGWEFEITLGNASDTTSHTVTVDQEYWQKLTTGKIPPQDLIKKSFIFLLQREAKESILPEFNLSVINTYFPEYEQSIST